MKIVSSGRGIHSPEFYKKKQKAKRIRLAIYALLALGFLILLIYFFRWQKFIISEVVVADEIAVDREEIMEAVQEGLRGHYLYFIPKNNAFIYQRRSIREKLLNEFPRFNSLNLNLEGFKKLVISADERGPFALYCLETDNCFFLDEGGFIFAQAPSFSSGVYFVYKIDNPIENPMGERFLSENAFRGLTKFINALPDLGIRSSTLEIGTDDYRLILNNGTEIIWKRDVDLAIIYSNLEAFLSDEAIASQSNFLDKVTSLDLRTENKVFWKLRN